MSLSCFVLYCVLHILSSLNVESKAVNTNSECVENCLAHQSWVEVTPQLWQAVPGTGRVLGSKAGEMALPRSFKQNPFIRLGFCRILCERDGLRLCLGRNFCSKKRDINREK